jgi:hypothetical protein
VSQPSSGPGGQKLDQCLTFLDADRSILPQQRAINRRRSSYLPITKRCVEWMVQYLHNTTKPQRALRDVQRTLRKGASMVTTLGNGRRYELYLYSELVNATKVWADTCGANTRECMCSTSSSPKCSFPSYKEYERSKAYSVALRLANREIMRGSDASAALPIPNNFTFHPIFLMPAACGLGS